MMHSQREIIYHDKTREYFASGVPRGAILSTLEPSEEKNGYLIFNATSAETFIMEEDAAPLIKKLEKTNAFHGLSMNNFTLYL